MKNILRNTCILAALMILSVFSVSVIWSGITEDIKLVFELFILAFLISAAVHFFDEFTSLPILMNYIVKYFGISFIVMLFGFITGWFYPTNFLMAFIYVGIVLVIAYFIDGIRIKKDIEYINRQINDRKEKGGI